MEGYQIDFAAMKNAMSNFETLLGKFQKEMKEIENTKTTTLNDNVWKGPNKTEFIKSLETYQAALEELYKTSAEHLTKLSTVVQAYANAETK